MTFVINEMKKRKINITKEDRVAKEISFDQLFKDVEIKDGMTISFNHHLRNGDFVLDMVMKEIEKLGVKDLTIFASSIFPCHEILVDLMERGIVTNIYSAYISGPVGDAISAGKLSGECIMYSHGGRPAMLWDNEIEIDVAFMAIPTVDKKGNMTGVEGKSSVGALGYPVADAHFAKTFVAITDNLVSQIEKPMIQGKFCDYIVAIDQIGDPSKIVSGTTQITKNPIGLRIARLATDAIIKSPYYKEGFSFQTGAGGVSLAVADFLKQDMINTNTKGSFAAGGITKYIVDMLDQELFAELQDCQCFDLDAIASIEKNANHHFMSASKYANPYADNMVDKLDFVVLGATEIDLDFNVNVTTTSDGQIMGGSGGHSDTAAGANMSIIVSTLVNARISAVKDKVTCITTPGQTIDLFVCEYGIAVNPRRTDLIDAFKAARLPVKTMDELYAIATRLTKVPNKIEFTNEVVAQIKYRDGQIIDKVYMKK